MKMIDKDYNAMIALAIISTILLFTNTVYSSPFSKETLRVPVGNMTRPKETIKTLTSKLDISNENSITFSEIERITWLKILTDFIKVKRFKEAPSLYQRRILLNEIDGYDMENSDFLLLLLRALDKEGFEEIVDLISRVKEDFASSIKDLGEKVRGQQPLNIADLILEYALNAEAYIPYEQEVLSADDTLEKLENAIGMYDRVDPLAIEPSAMLAHVQPDREERYKIYEQLKNKIITERIHEIVKRFIDKINTEHPGSLEAVSIVRDSSYNTGFMMSGSDLDVFHFFVRDIPIEKLQKHEKELTKLLDSFHIDMPQRPVFISLNEVEKEIKEKGESKLIKELDAKVNVVLEEDIEEYLIEEAMTPLDYTFVARNFGSIFGDQYNILDTTIEEHDLGALVSRYSSMANRAQNLKVAGKEENRKRIFGEKAQLLWDGLSLEALRAIIILDDFLFNEQVSCTISRDVLRELAESKIIKPIPGLDFAESLPEGHEIGYSLTWRNQRDGLHMLETHGETEEVTFMVKVKDIPSNLTEKAQSFIKVHKRKIFEMLKERNDIFGRQEIANTMGKWHQVKFYGVGDA